MPDVTIIGGGPAGSTAALLLARAGWDVTLIEQSRFPRDKVCGESLSALGFDVLTRLGLAGELSRLGAVRLDRCAVHAPSGRSLVVRLPQPMWGLSRHALDGLLLGAATGTGARVRQPVRCEGITFPDRQCHPSQAAGAAQRSLGSIAQPAPTDPGLRSAPHPAWQETRENDPCVCPLVRLRDLTTNTVETVSPTHVILADGKAAFASDAPGPTGDFGIKTHFEHVDGPRDAIELFGVHGSYGGLAPIEGGRWNAAFSVPAARLKAVRGELDLLFAELVRENPALARRLAAAQRTADWLAAPLPRFAMRNHWAPNVTPVGNAAAALEPIGGEGMGLAMRSAELAASELIVRTRNGSDCRRSEDGRLRDAYNRLWRTRRLGCRAAAVAVSSRAAGALLVLARLSPLPRAALRLMGK